MSFDKGEIDDTIIDAWSPDVSAYGSKYVTPGTAQPWSDAVDIAYTPHRWQAWIHEHLRRFSVTPCHRRFGKTVMAVNGLIKSGAALKFPDGRFGYIAPFRSQAKDVAWVYLKRYTANLPELNVSESDLYVEFRNAGGHTSRIRLYGADNPKAIRGIYFDGVVLDEVADMDHDVWGAVVRPMLTDRRGWAHFIGTPKGINLFSDMYYSAADKMRAGNPNYYADIFPDSRTKLTPADELASLKGTDTEPGSMTDTQFRQEYECDFSASNDNTLITIDMVTKAVSRFILPGDYSAAPRILGVDVARYGSDRSVITQRQGLFVHEPKIHMRVDNMTLAGHVARLIDDWQPDAVFVDAGRGEGVIDRLRQLKYPVVEVNFGGSPLDPHYQNKRAEMWDTMARWVQSGGVLPKNKDLRTDLCAPTYTYKNAANKFELESKDSMKKRLHLSPDMGDALALTFAYPVAAKRKTLVAGKVVMALSSGKKDWDYDPIARAEAQFTREAGRTDV